MPLGGLSEKFGANTRLRSLTHTILQISSGVCKMTLLLIIIIMLVVTWGLYELIFYITHLHPLSQSEIMVFANKRRKLRLKDYFKFGTVELTVDKVFKSRMKATGKLYHMNESLNVIPSLVAALLKGKKHEWIVLAFEKDANIDYLWVNKGADGKSVIALWQNDDIKNFALQKNIGTILQFHNHPNSNPRLYDCTMPSQVDMKSAEVLSAILNPVGINLIEFVCERGKHYQYYSSYSDKFLPITEIVKEIEQINGKDKGGNYRLHRELRKLKKLY